MIRFFLGVVLLWGSLFGQTLRESLIEHIQYSDEGPNYVGHIYIGDHQSQISEATLLYVKSAVEHFLEEIKPIFVILELDTPGGQVYAAQKISDLLMDLDTQYGIPVVAYINNWAISAGAMLAYSCRYIATAKDGSMGAAQPVTQTGEATSEKVNSAIRADFANRAGFYDRNRLIAMAMVDADMVLVERDGKILELESNEAIEPGDRVITRKEKLLTLDSAQMMALGVADLLILPEKLAPITKAERAQGRWPASKSPLFTEPFFKEIPNATIVSYSMDWKAKFFAFLSSPIVSSVLLFAVMICFYIEISTPGFGVPGAIGLGALFLIILSRFAVQAASWFEFIILGAGVAMILIELFLIPGFGIIGIIGIILAIAGLFALMLPGIQDFSFDFDTNTFNAAGQFILERLAWYGATFIVGVVVIALLAKFLLPRISLFSPLILRGEQEAKRGFVAGLPKEKLPEIGAEGIVISPLRTAGKVEIEGEIYDAVSSGKFLEKGEKIQVIEIEGSKMIVEEIS